MTATNANNVILSKGGTTVTISTTADEENLTKALTTFNPPTSKQDQNIATGTQPTKIVDLLLKTEERITVDGFLATGLRTVAEGDSSETAEGKKTDLKKIFLAGGVVDITYEGSTFTVGIDKLSIKRILTDGLAANDGEVEFSVKFTAIRGEDI